MFSHAVSLLILNEDEGPLSDFVLEDLYFDDIEYNGTALTPENAVSEIGVTFPDGYAFDWENVRVNSLENPATSP